jgi:hypothetical protein
MDGRGDIPDEGIGGLDRVIENPLRVDTSYSALVGE